MSATVAAGASAGIDGTGASAGSGVSSSVAAMSPAQRQQANSSIGSEIDQKMPKQVASLLAGSTLSLQEVASLSGALKASVRASLGKLLGISGAVGAGGGASPMGGLSLAVAVGTKVQAGASKAPTGALSVKAGLKFSIGSQLKASLGTFIESGLLGAGVQASQRSKLRSELEPALGQSLDNSLQSAFGPDPGYPHASGSLILGAEVTMQTEGTWFADVALDVPDDENVPDGPFSFEIEGVEFRGTVAPARSGQFAGRTHLRVIGGAGGLDAELRPVNYAGGVTKIQTIVSDILRESGETLSSESDQALLSTQVSGWHRMGGPGRHALTQVLKPYGATWRVLRDGTVWVGTDGWPEVTPNGTVLDVHHGDGMVLSAPDIPDAVPGIVVEGHRILQVVHRLDERGLRTEHHAKSVRSSLDKFLEPVRTDIDYSRTYPATVITQNADGTLQVMPDDDRIKGSGLDRCVIYVGLPGTTVKVPHGAQCKVAFSAGDPSRAHVEGWAMGTKFTSIDIA